MKWIRDGMELRVLDHTFADYSNPGYVLNESIMDPVQQWCWAHMPTARRMSFDTFRFESEDEIILFLLRWS